MAQAAKHLRKNKDLEAQLEQERKEKEEETIKKRSRSRDKKRKVLGLFTGGVVRVGWWGGKVGREGWLERGTGRLKRPPPTFFLCQRSCGKGCRGTHGNPVMSVFLLCVHSLPGAHVCPPHTDTGKRYNTLHAFLLLSTALYLLYWLSCLTRLIW